METLLPWRQEHLFRTLHFEVRQVQFGTLVR